MLLCRMCSAYLKAIVEKVILHAVGFVQGITMSDHIASDSRKNWCVMNNPKPWDTCPPGAKQS